MRVRSSRTLAVEGAVLVNGRPRREQQFSKISAYVPQVHLPTCAISCRRAFKEQAD
jgi:hypothetical protein